MDLTDKSQLLNYLKEKGIWAKKGLSQNFLVDKEALEKIVEAAEIQSEELVLEVGPGIGTLTEQLTDMAKRVVSVELDKNLAELLPIYFSNEHGGLGKQINLPNAVVSSTVEIRLPDDHILNVVQADILRTNIPYLVGSQNYKVVANIPYAITSRIIKLFLTQKNKPSSIVMLVQKEVAERICAKPGDMSVLALSVQAYGRPEIVSVVPAESFFPAPKVDSAILKIEIESSKLKADEEKEFFRCIKIGFSSKRKKLLNNLSAGYHLNREIVSDIIKKSSLSEDVRAEDLSIEDWLNLSKYLSE